MAVGLCPTGRGSCRSTGSRSLDSARLRRAGLARDDGAGSQVSSRYARGTWGTRLCPTGQPRAAVPTWLAPKIQTEPQLSGEFTEEFLLGHAIFKGFAAVDEYHGNFVGELAAQVVV